MLLWLLHFWVIAFMLYIPNQHFLQCFFEALAVLGLLGRLLRWAVMFYVLPE
jgi:hypothetical protein